MVVSEWDRSVIFHLALALPGSVQVLPSLQSSSRAGPLLWMSSRTETVLLREPLASGSLWPLMNAFGDCQTRRVFISSEGNFSGRHFPGNLSISSVFKFISQKTTTKVIIFSYVCRVWVCDLLFQPVSSPVQLLAQSKILFKLRPTFTLFYRTSPFISAGVWVHFHIFVFFFLSLLAFFRGFSHSIIFPS